MSDSTDITGGDAGGQGPAPVSWEPPIGSPAMSPLETLGDGVTTDILPAAEPRAPRSKRPWLIGTAVAAVLVLVLGGAAAALLLNRPDVKLQRALSATTDRPTGSMTMSVRASGAGADDAQMQELLDKGAVRVAWDKASDTQQYVVLMNDEAAFNLVVAPDSLVVSQDLKATGIPEVGSLLENLTQLGATMGPDGEAFVKFAEGSPLRIATGPDSAFGKLMKESESAGGSQPRPDDAKLQAFADKVQQSVRDHVVVTEEGSDDTGDHLRATIPVKAVVADVLPALADLVGQAAPTDALSSIKGDPQVSVDIWVKDGVITKVEIPLGEIARQAGGDSTTPDVTLVIAMSDTGVVMPTGDVVDLPDSMFDGLGSGLLGGLGGLGGLGAGAGADFGVESSSDFDFTESS
jgi:hypothetical protein